MDELPFGVREIRSVSHPQFAGASGQKSTAKSSDSFDIFEFSNKLLENVKGRVLEVSYSKAVLLQNYKRWNKSRLALRSEPSFDLLALVRTHQKVVHNELPVVILAVYGKDLDNIESCFEGFQKEARSVAASAVAVITSSVDIDNSAGQITFENIPQNPLAELGLSRKAGTKT